MRVRVLISGQVQGVFFRAFTKRKAEELELSGWVRNLPDGRVEAVFEGEKEKLREMIEWCKEGSPVAEVTSVEEVEEIEEGLGGFEIIR